MSSATTFNHGVARRAAALRAPTLDSLLAGALGRLRSQAVSGEEQALRCAVREAAAVRALASAQRGVSPGFASDLNAAADRHESAAAAALEAKR